MHSRSAALALPLNVGAYVLWAGATLLFKRLEHLPVWQVFAHRIVWSLLFCVAIQACSGGFRPLRGLLESRRRWLLLIPTSLLIASNWLLVIWAVGEQRLTEASLGYYLAPLCTLLLAKQFFGEPWKRGELPCLLVALLGVGLIGFANGEHGVPWIGLVIAVTFALYSALKKIGNVPPLPGLTLETAVAAIPAVLLLWGNVHHDGWFPAAPLDCLLLVAIGLVTTVPMLFYVVSVPSLSMTLVGYLQYLNPTFMFLLALFVFREPFSPLKLIGFALIWIALFRQLTNNRNTRSSSVAPARESGTRS